MHGTHGLQVAVVDDDALTREVICGMLQGMGYRAVAFESAAALTMARRAQIFHALVLDLSMPDVDGFELIEQLADQQPVEPVIISSSMSNAFKEMADMVFQSKGIRVLGILSKPYSRDELGFVLEPYTRSLAAIQG
jgi:CheY-like chemotaxis protein